jgi:hypothetical protein
MSKIKSYFCDKIEQSEAYYMDSKEPTKVISQKGSGRPLEGPTRRVKLKGKGWVATESTGSCRAFKSI